MNRIVTRILWFVGLMLLQVLFFNRIHWFNVTTPYFYIYLLLTLDQDTSRSGLLLWGFAIGLAMDIFSNTFGVHAAATTLIAFLRPGIQRLFYVRDDNEIFEPGIRAMGAGAFWPYALLCTLVHHAAVFILEFFSFAHPVQLLLHIGASTLLTMFFIIAVELIRYRKL